MSSGIDISQAIKSSSAVPVQEAAQQALSRAGFPPHSAQAGAPTDSVQVSQAGSFLNGVSNGKMDWGAPIKTNPPIPHTAEELNTWFTDFRDAVRKSIENIFSQNGLQLQQPVTLQNTTDGSVQVSGDHPQAPQIQQLVNATPQVGDQLQSLNQRSELYQVLAHANDLRHASNDGEHSQAAAALSEHLNNPTPFHLTLSPSSSGAASSSTSQA